MHGLCVHACMRACVCMYSWSFPPLRQVVFNIVLPCLRIFRQPGSVGNVLRPLGAKDNKSVMTQGYGANHHNNNIHSRAITMFRSTCFWSSEAWFVVPVRGLCEPAWTRNDVITALSTITTHRNHAQGPWFCYDQVLAHLVSIRFKMGSQRAFLVIELTF